ncbi:MAG: hypothetical protein FJZ00_07720, partial [Candidatus Sericytochromatia bacterium]|nr:hypothetical protein [Candidatus Tanganyikabacteria bacterium]
MVGESESSAAEGSAVTVRESDGSVLELLVGGLFDYAGMFPPASLDFEEMLRTAAGFEETLARPWLVGAEAVIPADRLAAMTPDLLLSSGFASPLHVRVALLGGLDVPEMLSETVLVSWEAKVEAFDGAKVRAAAESANRQGMRFYVEPQWTPRQWHDGVSGLAAALGDLNKQVSGPGVGLKVRGSGPTAIDAPALATVIAAVNRAGIPFKATAGLHHPLIEADVYGNSIGFLGLVAALRLQRAIGPDNFDDTEVVACLQSAEAADFDFSEGLAWRSLYIS